MFFKRQAPAEEQHGFRGVWAAAVTPHRRENFEADFAALLELVDRLGRSGIDGIVLMGATGEFPHVKTEERQRALHLAIKRSRVPIIAAVSHSTLDIAIQLAGAAIDSGAAGLLLMPPYFYRYRPEEILEFYRVFAVAVRGALPALLYNIPAFTNAISIDVARELLVSGEFAGIKDSSGDPEFLDDLAALRKEHMFSLLCGNDRLIRRALAAGADGLVSGVACAAPELVVALYQAARSGSAEVPALERDLNEIIEWIERFPVPVGIAAAVEVRGAKVGPPALPLTEKQFDELEQFKDWFAQKLPYFQKISHA
jgi:dihydrodipicolinate synthase/N-acetylneuraminate lyase